MNSIARKLCHSGLAAAACDVGFCSKALWHQFVLMVQLIQRGFAAVSAYALVYLAKRYMTPCGEARVLTASG